MYLLSCSRGKKMGIEIEIKNEGKEEEKNSTLNLDIRFIFLLPLYSETVELSFL